MSIYYSKFIRSSAVFKTIGSGDASVSSVYAIQRADTTWETVHSYTPDCAALGNLTEGNNLYVEAGHTLTLSQDLNVKDIYLNAIADVIRLVHNGHEVVCWGKLAFYLDMSVPVNPITASGVTGWLGEGVYRYKGLVSRVVMVQGEINANNTNSGHSIKIDFTTGASAFINDRYRAYDWEVVSGILDNTGAGTNMVRYTLATQEIRIGTNTGSTDTAANGTFTVRSGAEVVVSTGIFKKNGYAGSSIVVEAGAVMRTAYSIKLGAATIQMLGTFILEANAAQNFPSAVGYANSVSPDTFNNFICSGSGAKSLQYNTTITGTLTLSGSVTLNLNSKTLTYSAGATLEYLGGITRIRGSELPSSGSLPTHVRIEGVLDMGGANIVLPAGSTIEFINAGSITNGTLTTS